MTRKRKNRGGASRFQNGGQSQASDWAVRAAAGQFASAVVKQNEPVLQQMYRMSEGGGGIGSSKSILAELQGAGVTSHSDIATNGNTADILLHGPKGPSHIMRCKILEGSYVTDVELFRRVD